MNLLDMKAKDVNEKCVYCGVVGKMTRDHVVPRKLMP